MVGQIGRFGAVERWASLVWRPVIGAEAATELGLFFHFQDGIKHHMEAFMDRPGLIGTHRATIAAIFARV
jgi:hypothetical protein